MSAAVAMAVPSTYRATDPELLTLYGLHAEYVVFDDEDALLATLAAAVSAEDQSGEPCWLMLVGAPSGGKTENLRLLKYVAQKAVKDITLAGLMTITGKGRVYGLLPDVHGEYDTVVTITDFSSLLGSGDARSGSMKLDVFNALRDIYDGEYIRRLAYGEARWQGKVTVVAACTSAIDRYAAHSDALGTRWLYLRLPDRDQATQHEMARFDAGRENINALRTAAQEQAARVIEAARARLASVTLSPETEDAIAACALVLARGRASVPRDFRHEIVGMAEAEEPGRAAHQLKLLAKSLFAFGLAEDHVHEILRRVARSTMPEARATVLSFLARQDPTATFSSRQVGLTTEMNWSVAKWALQDMHAVGVVADNSAADDTEQAVTRRWHLHPDWAAYVRWVFA